MRRSIRAAALVALGIFAVGGGWLIVLLSDDGVPGGSRRGEAPMLEVSPEEAELVLGYLDRDGSMLTEMADALPTVIPDSPDRATCQRAASGVDRRFPRDEVFAKLYELPDPTLGELLGGWYGVVVGALDQCREGEDISAYREDSGKAKGLVSHRMRQLREAR